MTTRVDYHVHSQYSYCTKDITIEKLAELATRKGMQQFFITDHSSHLYFDEKTAWEYGYLKDYQMFQETTKTNRNRVNEYLNEVRKFSSQGARAGMEIECAFNGEFILEPDYFGKLDLVLSGVHYLPCLAKKEPSLAEFINEFLDYTLMILDKDIDVLTHPTRIFRRSNLDIPKELYSPIIDKAVSKGIALEINSHSQKDPDENFVREAIMKGAKLALGTDSHNLKEFGDFSWHLDLLARCGIKSEKDLEKVLFSIAQPCRRTVLSHRRLSPSRYPPPRLSAST